MALFWIVAECARMGAFSHVSRTGPWNGLQRGHGLRTRSFCCASFPAPLAMQSHREHEERKNKNTKTVLEVGWRQDAVVAGTHGATTA